MGLKNGLSLKGGVNITNAYIKINNIYFDSVTNKVSFDFLCYKDKATRDENVKNKINHSISLEVLSDDEDFTTVIEPVINQLKQTLYVWSKKNKLQTFSDVLE
jgi:hypothetical protein